eukprot:NODE_1513_length_1505_cov_24.030907_g1366_i0.p1 GENE.NODE_1513_length_1505_cov_24.030907_g1366_i0~~NODE_1513_length_1505_cov_24.030907_g1366_i0.p1  ORF type:complete len:258 (+),score=69.36 NODE_1513_length_1505_cov_24.030907_g1366_i0:178-951(+)
MSQTTPAEIAKITAHFKRHDSDGDQMIDKTEFNHMLRRMGILLSPADEAKLFATIDTDRNSKIDVNEFVAQYHTILSLERRAEEKQMEVLTQRTKFSEEEVRAMYANFKRLATAEKDDGVIDRLEFRQMMVDSSLDAHRNAVFYDGLFRMFDRDGSGDIDFTEFVLALALYYGKSNEGTTDTKAKFFFNILDVDGDSMVSQDDLQRILADCLAANDVSFSSADITKLVQATFAKYKANLTGDKISFQGYRDLAANKA